MNNKNEKNHKKSKSKIIIISISTIFIIASILFASGYYIVNKIANKTNKVQIEENNLAIVPEEELQQYENYTNIVNIALFGIDSTDSTSGRSDSIMVATLDPIHNKLKLTSFMRDSYVSIEGYGYDKLNHAYAYGGPELALNTLNSNFGLNLTDFISVDFQSLPKIIDILGGIDLEITTDEISYINDYINHINSVDGTNSPNIDIAGVYHVDGVQALAYSRIRYTSGGDFERTERQRTVLTALFNQALTVSPSQYLNVISSLTEFVTTNLGTNDMLKLASQITSMGLNGISLESQRFPLDDYCYGDMIDGIYYLIFDNQTTKEQVMNYIFDDTFPE